MALKKKGGGGKKRRAKATPIIDGLPPEEMNKEHIMRIREELDREREECNYFQLERDKIHTFWGITRRQLEEKAGLRQKEREMDEAEERHQVETEVDKQKVKHLLYEHQNSLTEMKAEGSPSLKLAQEEPGTQEKEMRADVGARDPREEDARGRGSPGPGSPGPRRRRCPRTWEPRTQEEMRTNVSCLNVELKGQKLVGKNLSPKRDEIARMRNDSERQAREMESKYDKKREMLPNKLGLRRRTEIREAERKQARSTTAA